MQYLIALFLAIIALYVYLIGHFLLTGRVQVTVKLSDQDRSILTPRRRKTKKEAV